MSDSSSDSGSGFRYCPKKTIEICLTKLHPVDGDKAVHDLMHVLYKAKPECFQPIAGIHNSEDGKETYQSYKIWISKTFYQNLHVYGKMRGYRFEVERMVLFAKGKQYEMIMKNKEGGSGGGGRYEVDKSPW